MKAKFKRWRDRRKFLARAFKRIIYSIIFIGVVYISAVWVLPRIHLAGSRNIDPGVVSAYYDLLSKHAESSKAIVLDLGKGTDSLGVALDRLKEVMGLGAYAISLESHNNDKPPAYITDYGYGRMKIFVSDKIKKRREKLNLLVHELGHVYVKRLDRSVFGDLDQEKLVDCAGVFLGLGVLTLNGLTDDFVLLLGGGYEEKKKSFGYLNPEQYGYLLARYCADRGIRYDIVRPYLNQTGKKYFDMGCGYIRNTRYRGNNYAGSVWGLIWKDDSSEPERLSLAGE
ncbi:MAG: hypothetical protein KBB52_01595 [Candidatus Omnitrophica bacterium]|nr:hypothetical protein [Candidatus Omnitrophota bacterium]